MVPGAVRQRRAHDEREGVSEAFVELLDGGAQGIAGGDSTEGVGQLRSTKARFQNAEGYLGVVEIFEFGQASRGLFDALREDRNGKRSVADGSS